MAGVGAAIAGSIAGAAGSALGNIGSTIYSTERNIANANWNIERQMAFEKMMASTQYQRAIEDMKEAGLNPGSLGMSLSPNSAPSGAAATGNYGHALGVDFSNMFSNAVSAAIAKDRNFHDEIMQELKDETAVQVQAMRNDGRIRNEIQKKALGHSAYWAWRNNNE